jgi:hypothetical protein
LSPLSAGGWAFFVLHVFLGQPALNPTAGVILDGAGNLYRTTGSCGSAAGCMEVVIEITP